MQSITYRRNQLSKKQYLGYGLIGIVAPLAFVTSLATTAVLNPALLAYMGIIILAIMGAIASITAMLMISKSGHELPFCCLISGVCGKSGKEAAVALLICLVAFVLLGMTLGVIVSGLIGLGLGIKKLGENEKMKGGVLISSSLALLTLFIAPLVVSLINPNIKKFIWPSTIKKPFENFNMSEIAKQIDPKTKVILITCIVVTLILSVIGFFACSAKFGLFGEKANDTQAHVYHYRQKYGSAPVRPATHGSNQNPNSYNNGFSQNLYKPTTTTQGSENPQINNSYGPPPAYSTFVPNSDQKNNNSNAIPPLNDETQGLDGLRNWASNVNNNNITYNGQHSNGQRANHS